jgi:hypothetical protein
MHGTTLNAEPLLATPDTITTTSPVLAPGGTFTTTFPEFQLVSRAFVPLKITVPFFRFVPKFEPAIVTVVPIAPDAGETEVMLGELACCFFGGGAGAGVPAL